MKKILVLALIIAMGVAILCGCSKLYEESVYEQTGNLGYKIEKGWTSRTVTPAPSTLKQYNYPEHTVFVGNLSYFFYEDPLLEAIQYAIGSTYDMGMGFERYDCTVSDMAAKEAVIDSGNLFGVFTSIETPQGTYIMATTTENSELDIEAQHSALKKTVIFSDADDGEVYTENVIQFTDYICSVPDWSENMIDSPWWITRTAEHNGVISYDFGSEATSLKVVPMDAPELTDELIKETLGCIYDGIVSPAATCTLSDPVEMKCSLGSAVYYVLDLHFGEDKSNTVKASAVFVKDESGQVICCMSNTSDWELTYDYSAILESMQPAEPVYEQVDIIFSMAADYIGDNSAVGNLMNAVGFGKYGEYTIELHTEKEPYGLTVKYKGQVAQDDVLYKDNTVPYDFQRECVMMLGMIGNLEYIKIKDVDSDIVRYDTNVTKSLLMYDVKVMAEDKAVLKSYYLETLF